MSSLGWRLPDLAPPHGYTEKYFEAHPTHPPPPPPLASARCRTSNVLICSWAFSLLRLALQRINSTKRLSPAHKTEATRVSNPVWHFILVRTQASLCATLQLHASTTRHSHIPHTHTSHKTQTHILTQRRTNPQTLTSPNPRTFSQEIYVEQQAFPLDTSFFSDS